MDRLPIIRAVSNHPEGPQRSPVGRKPAAWLAVGLVTGALVWSGAHLFSFVNRHAVECLYQDQWDFLDPLFQGRGAWACFIHQHGPHRQGLGLLLTGWVYDLTSWSTRAEGFVMAAVLVLAALVAVLVSVRLRGRIALADGALVLLFLTTVQFESIVIVPAMSHSVVPLLLIVGASAVALMRSPVRRLSALVPLHLACTFTGFAIFGSAAIAFALAAHLVVALRRHVRREVLAATVALAAAAATYALFLAGYRWDPAVPGWRFPAGPASEYIRFVANLYAHPFGWIAPSPASAGFGAVVLCLVAAAAFVACRNAVTAKDERDAGRWCAAAIPALASLGFAVNAAVGRVPLGASAAFAPRYTSWALLGVAAVLFACAAAGSERPAPRWTEAAVGVLALACLLVPSRRAEELATRYAGAKRAWAATYLRTGSIAAAQAAHGGWFPAHPRPESAQLPAKLAYLRAHHLNLFRAAGPDQRLQPLALRWSARRSGNDNLGTGVPGRWRPLEKLSAWAPGTVR